MTLSSQTRRQMIGVRSSRPSGSWRKRRRQRRARRLAALVVIAGAAVGGWWLWGGGPEGPEAAGAAVADASGETREAPGGAVEREEVLPEPIAVEEAPKKTIAATPETSDREPAVFRMGRPVEVERRPASTLGQQIREAARPTVEPENEPKPEPALGAEVPDESGAAPARPVFSSPEPVRERILWGMEAIEQNRLVDARRLLSEALLDDRCAPADKPALRESLAAVNETLVFSPTIASDDPLSERYIVQPGDALSRIARKTGADIDWRFIQRINRISDPRRIRVGQTLKIVKGPFHAIVDKSDYRMDLFAEVPGASSGEPGVVYIRSFPVGLGELDSTPEGEWIVRNNSKLVNPDWTNPRTGERFDKNDPMNPIGERWIGLRGTDPQTEALSGYGIHGTIEPSSIGQQESMGCVRLLDDDVELVYELLEEGKSRVAIVD